jgi:hypothetical protein
MVRDILENQRRFEQSMTAREKLYHLSIRYHIADLIFNLWNICSPLAIITLLRVLFEKWGNPYSLEHFQECQLFIESLSTAQEGNYRDEELLLALKDKERHVRDIFVTLVRLAELNLQEAIDILVFAVKYKTSEVLQEEDNKGLYEITSVAFSKRVIETLSQRFIRDIFELILSIQSRCQFYNYDIAQLPPPQRTERVEDLLHNKLNIITQEIKKVTEQPKRVIHTQNYFEKGTHTHTHNYANNETLKQQIPEVRQLVHQLQQIHQPTTEVQAAEIIDVEFREIQKTNPTRWQTIRKQLQLLKRQILNPESHLKATKATLAEISKHYLEDSLMAKATITYLDTLSAETDQGE